MNRVVETHLDQLRQLCRRYEVARLELFGSATANGFDDAKSDLDFLVECQPCTPNVHARAYFGLLLDMEDMFGRHVDLVETKAVKNPYFLASIKSTREPVYGT